MFKLQLIFYFDLNFQFLIDLLNLLDKKWTDREWIVQIKLQVNYWTLMIVLLGIIIFDHNQSDQSFV